MTQDSKIKDLVAGQQNVYVKNCEVVETKGVEEYVMQGKPTKVCNATIKDDTGEIKITAWEGEFHNLLAEAKKIDVLNCFCKKIGGGQYEGQLQLTLGKFGRIKKLE